MEPFGSEPNNNMAPAGFESPVGTFVPEDMPEEWGGRPKGSSRRAQRMQAEWDDKRKRQIDEYNIMRQAYESDRSFYLQEKNQAMDATRLGIQQAEFDANKKLKDQSDYEAGAFIQGFNNLDPRSPDYFKGVADLRKQFPLGSLDPRVGKVVEDYNGVHKVYMDNLAERQADAEAIRKESQKVAKISKQSGLPMSNFITTDPRTGMDVINYEALGRAEAVVAQKEVKTEEPRYGGKTQKELDAIISGINADIADASVRGDNSLDVLGLEAKRKYYEGLLPKDNKDVANTAKSQYIPVNEREAGKVYPTPQGDLKWTGSGWTKP